MPLESNIALARVLAGGTGLGVRELATIEEEREREQELARAIKGQERGRRAKKQLGRGRLVGGGIGALLGTLLAPATGGLSLLLPALATAGGSFAGQKVLTRKTGRERLRPIGVGSFQRARGRERETEFKAGERAFREDLGSAISGGAVSDFMSALAFQSLLPGLFGKTAGLAGTEVEQTRLLLPQYARLSDIDRRGLVSIFQSLGVT